MSSDLSDVRGRLHAAEIAIDQDEPEVAVEALVKATEEVADAEQLIDAGHELKSQGMKLRDGGENDE